MKNKKFIKIALSITLSLVLLLSCFAIFVGAKSDGEIEEWEAVDNKGQSITDGTYQYTVVCTLRGYDICGTQYMYYNHLFINGDAYSIYAPSKLGRTACGQQLRRDQDLHQSGKRA